MKEIFNEFMNGLVVSCYAGSDLNEEMAFPEVMACVAKSCVNGGAKAIRTNLENISAIKRTIDKPIIGIKKIYKSGGISNGDFRITPTLKEVELIVNSGADIVAIDGTRRDRYDDLSLREFIAAIHNKWNIGVVTDVSTVEEGIEAWKSGADAIGTTLSGYTSYSKHPIKFGQLPLPEPDYEIISSLKQAGVPFLIAEGRIDNGIKMRRALNAGASAVVSGTSITEPKKIVKTILLDAKKGEEE